MTITPPEYKPGSCNLGTEEIRRRYRIGLTGLIGFLIWCALIWHFDLPRGFRLAAFIPLFYSVSGFIQATQRFCYIYGWKGVASVKGLRQWTRVEDDASRHKDRQKTIRLVGIIFLISSLLTALYYWI